jgi:outer membrane protein
MKNKLIIIALFIIGLGTNAVYAQTPKIGYVDSRAVSDKLPEVKQAYAQLNEFSKQKENELRKEAEAFQAKVEEFEKGAQGMAQELATAKQRELQSLQEQLQIKQTNAQADVQKRQQQIFDPIEKRIQEAITQVANENGYTYVFAKEVLLHSPAGDDISELVTKKLLASAPKQPTSSNTPAQGQGATNTPAQGQGSQTAPKKK